MFTTSVDNRPGGTIFEYDFDKVCPSPVLPLAVTLPKSPATVVPLPAASKAHTTTTPSRHPVSPMPSCLVLGHQQVGNCIHVLDYLMSQHINFLADITTPEDDGIVQIEEFGVHVHFDGTVMYGLEVNSVMESLEHSLSMDKLARLLVDIQQDSSFLTFSITTAYQRVLMDTMSGGSRWAAPATTAAPLLPRSPSRPLSPLSPSALVTLAELDALQNPPHTFLCSVPPPRLYSDLLPPPCIHAVSPAPPLFLTQIPPPPSLYSLPPLSVISPASSPSLPTASPPFPPFFMSWFLPPFLCGAVTPLELPP